MQTALISALTAAVVTMLIEYFAKPLLESRKDRYLEKSRGQRAVRARIVLFRRQSARLSLIKPDSYNPETFSKRFEDIEAICRDFVMIAESFPRHQAILVERYLLFAKLDLQLLRLMLAEPGIANDFLKQRAKSKNNEMHDPFDIVSSAVAISARVAHEAISLSRWHPWSYYTRIRKLSNVA